MADLKTGIVEHKVDASVLQGLNILPNSMLIVLQDEVTSGSLGISPDRLQIGDVGVG